MQGINPIIYADYPDPDVVLAGGVYYMVSTAMHLFPGAQILRSYDLLRWEHCSYVYDALGETPPSAWTADTSTARACGPRP